jgi:regulator of protease activity HflC (stomatin/prohibitin superfamily)
MNNIHARTKMSKITIERGLDKIDLDSQRLLTYNRRQCIHATAVREAQELPVMADQEAQMILQKARAEAEEEARQLVAKAQAQDEIAQILAQAQEKNRQVEALAKSNFDRAVNYILDRVIGRE